MSATSASEQAEFDNASGILTIPQVKVGSQYVYDARLQLNNQGLFNLLGYSNTPPIDTSNNETFVLTSQAVVDGELLDAYKCEAKENGIEKSIPLSWSGVPAAAGALAVIMHHFPNPNDSTQTNSYLLLWDIDPAVSEIAHGAADDGPWYMGANKDGNAISYTSPCSPSSGSHEYTITLYALAETPSSLPHSNSLQVTYEILKAAIEGATILGSTSLTFNDVTP